MSTARAYNVVSRVASAVAGRQFRVEIDGVQVGAPQTAPSAGWQAFGNSMVSTASLSVGTHH